jgi:hypothetical protein
MFTKLRSSCFIPLLWILAANAWGSAQSFPPEWSSSATFTAGDQVQLAGNIYRAIKATASGQAPPTSNAADWELNFVRNNTTITIGVGQTFGTLTAAWNYVLNARVADGAYLHLYISSQHGNFTESFAAPILLDHASGARIAIIGDSATNDEMEFSNVNGFILDTGHAFNTLSGLTLYDPATDNQNDGLKVDLQATIAAVSNMVFDGFLNGIHATQSGSATVASGVTFPAITNAACLAESNGSVFFSAATTISPSTISANGVMADTGGVIYASGSLAITGCVFGAYAVQGGIIYLHNSDINESIDDGCLASSRGVIICEGGSVVNSVGPDLYAYDGGYIEGDNTTYGTKLDFFNSDGSIVVTS